MRSKSMWRESTEERKERCRKILAKTPELLAEEDALNVSAVLHPIEACAGDADAAQEEAENSGRDEVIRNVAQYVAGPALYVYIDWVIRSAVKAGQTRLYFLARDGYLMYHAAKIYCRINQINIDCRYLYCSRYALRIPMYHLNRKDAMEYICRNGMQITPERILRRSGLEAALCRQLAAEYFPQWKPDQQLSRQELAQLTEQLKTNDAFWELCAAHSRKAYPKAEQYLVQEGLLDDVPYALVDSGWIGSMQKTLGQLLTQIRATRPTADINEVKAEKGSKAPTTDHRHSRLFGYYWGLYDLPPGADPADYRAFYFTPASGAAEKIAFNNNLFEVLFSAPHGMTIGFQDLAGELDSHETHYLEGSKIKNPKSFQVNAGPILSDTQPEQVNLIRQMEPVMMAYVATVCQKAAEKRQPAKADSLHGEAVASRTREMNDERYRRVIRELFTCLMCQPTRAEAEVFGRVPFSDDIFAETGRNLAEQEPEQVLKSSHPVQKMLLAAGLKKGTETVLPWYEGSAVLSTGNTEKHLNAYLKYKKLLTKRQERNWGSNT